jgi:hypothetical protein
MASGNWLATRLARILAHSLSATKVPWGIFWFLPRFSVKYRSRVYPDPHIEGTENFETTKKALDSEPRPSLLSLLCNARPFNCPKSIEMAVEKKKLDM